MALIDYTANTPEAPFRNPVATEQGYIHPSTLRDFAQEVIDADEDTAVVGPSIYVQQTDPGAVTVNSIWFVTDMTGAITAMRVLVP